MAETNQIIFPLDANEYLTNHYNTNYVTKLSDLNDEIKFRKEMPKVLRDDPTYDARGHWLKFGPDPKPRLEFFKPNREDYDPAKSKHKAPHIDDVRESIKTGALIYEPKNIQNGKTIHPFVGQGVAGPNFGGSGGYIQLEDGNWDAMR